MRDFALTFPGAVEEHPWDHIAIKVKGKMFLILGGEEERLSVTTKLPSTGRLALLLPFATPTGYGLGKSGWVTGDFCADDSVPVDRLCEWIEESYRAIARRSWWQSWTESPSRPRLRRPLASGRSDVPVRGFPMPTAWPPTMTGRTTGTKRRNTFPTTTKSTSRTKKTTIKQSSARTAKNRFTRNPSSAPIAGSIYRRKTTALAQTVVDRPWGDPVAFRRVPVGNGLRGTVMNDTLEAAASAHLGCERCRTTPASRADLALEQTRSLYSDCHEGFALYRCRQCGQIYLEQFQESVDDDLWQRWVPLTADEVAEVERLCPTESEERTTNYRGWLP